MYVGSRQSSLSRLLTHACVIGRSQIFKSQHQLLSDYNRMKEIQVDERKAIVSRVNVYEPNVLEKVAEGDNVVLAAALGWETEAVEKSKGAWFEMEFSQDPQSTMSEKKVKEAEIIRGSGFSSSAARTYHREAEKLVGVILVLGSAPSCRRT